MAVPFADLYLIPIAFNAFFCAEVVGVGSVDLLQMYIRRVDEVQPILEIL